ncbi:hypothetical protein HRH25_16635 [Flavisolibacter sp. BT320]|nr:hypothetical protein [Flavisolibacter longurius]
MSDTLVFLIDKYLKGEANEAEREVVDAWYLSFETNRDLTDLLGPDEVGKAMAESFASFSRKLKFDKKDVI